jgi:5-methylcytosine-specific restriction endonuclease McrA
MRGRALLRDGWTCQKCGSRDDLEVHHVDLNANNNVIGNLLTLCADCHKEERNLPKTPGWSHSGHLRPIDQKPTKG